MQKRKKAWRGIVNIASLALCIVLGFRSQMVAYAYTEEEKAAAKQWLSQHGYSPDMGGANQAYQDYLNGKFDNEMPGNGGNQQDGTQDPNNQGGSQTPDGSNNQNGSQTPDGSNNQNGSQTPDGSNNQNGSQTPDGSNNQNGSQTPDSSKNQDGSQSSETDKKPGNSGTSVGEAEGEKGEPPKGSSDKDKGSSNDGNQTQIPNGGNETASPVSGTGQTEAGATPTQPNGEIGTNEMTKEQEAEFMNFLVTQLAEGNKKTTTVEEREKREAELYQQSLVGSTTVGDNETTDTGKDDSQETSVDNKEKEEQKGNVFQTWILVSIVAILALGGVCFWVIRKH